MQELAAAHAEQQARGGHEEAVHAGQDAREDRDGEDHAAEASEGHVSHSAGSPRVVLAEQVGVGNDDGHGNQDQGIQRRTAYDGVQHQAAGLFRRKVEFFSGLGNGIEADEQPGGDRHDGDDASPRRTAFCEQGEQVVERRGGRGEGTHRQDEHTGHQRKGKDELDAAGEVHAAEVHVPEEQEGAGHHGQFTGVHVPTGYAVQIPHVEHTRQQGAAEKGQRGAVGGDNAEIAKDEGPSANKGPCFAETDVGIGERAAGHGIGLDEDAISKGDETQEAAADNESQHTTDRPSLREEARPGKDEAAPTDDGAHGKSPNFSRAHRFLQFFTSAFNMFVAHDQKSLFVFAFQEWFLRALFRSPPHPGFERKRTHHPKTLLERRDCSRRH